MGELFDRYPGEVLQGKDITIGREHRTFFVSEKDEVFCYAGICLNEEDAIRRGLFVRPYYMDGLHSTDKKIAGEIRNFYRLADGCIYLDEYVDGHFWGDRNYKRLDVGLRLPSADTYYGVLLDHNEAAELTRAVFGLTCNELQKLLEAYAKVFGTYNDYFQYPRLTRSPRSANYCDMTDVWIPEKFPYIAFKESGQDFSHVSLWGFYRHIQLLTDCRLNSVVSQVLLKNGVDEVLLNRVFSVGRTCWHQEKVTKTLLSRE